MKQRKKKTQEQQREKKKYLAAKKGRFEQYDKVMRTLLVQHHQMKVLIVKHEKFFEACVKKGVLQPSEINQLTIEAVMP